MSSMRLLLITQDFPPIVGGIQSLLGELAPRLASHCEHFAVVAPGGERERVADQNLSFPVERIGVHTSWLALPLQWKLSGLMARHQPTHLLFGQWFPATAGVLWNRKLPQAAFAYGREYLTHPLGKLGLALCAPTCKRLDALLPISQRTASLLPTSVDPARIHVLRPGVDTVRMRPPTAQESQALRERLQLPPDRPIIVCLTRLVPRKGVDTLLAALAIVRQSLPNVLLVVGGKGPDLERLQILAHDSAVTDSVRFVGRIEDAEMPAFYALGPFTLLSREEKHDIEGFGLVLAEAQACGSAVVSARSGGMMEAMDEGKSGFVVPPNDPVATAQALLTLLQDPVLFRTMGDAGRRFTETELQWDRYAHEVFHVLSSLPSAT